MSPEEIEEIRRLELENYHRIQRERLAEQLETMTERSMYTTMAYGTNVFWHDGEMTKAQLAEMERQKALMQREHEKEEKKNLEELMETGSSRFDKYAHENGKLYVTGRRFDGGSVMCVIDRQTITAHPERSKHLKTLLGKLAKREGLELIWDEKAPDEVRSPARKVVYWAFKNRPVVDDSDLVNVNTPSEQISRRHGDEEDEPDCDCDDCQQERLESFTSMWTSDLPF
jgi:hypothetical protein